MFLKNIAEALKEEQKQYTGLQFLDGLVGINTDTNEGRLLMIMDILRMNRYFGYTFFYENKPGLSSKEIKVLLAQAKSYEGNKTIVGGKLKTIIEGLVFYFDVKKFDYTQLKQVAKGEVAMGDLELKANPTKIYNSKFLFLGESGTVYEGTGLQELRMLNTEKCVDILKGYKGDYERLKNSIPFLLNKDNEKELKVLASSYRNALLSALGELLKSPEDLAIPENKSKVINYIYEKLELTETTETKETVVTGGNPPF